MHPPPGPDRHRALRDRAIASLIGYLLVFAIVLGGAVVLSTLGLGLVLDSGETGEVHLPTVERFAEGTAAVAEDAPYRQLELEPHDASLTYGSPYTIRITASGGGVDRTGPNAIQERGRTVRYEAGDDRVLAYEAGLIADAQRNGTRPVVRSEPDIETAGSRVILVLPTTRKAPRSSVLISTGVRGSVPVSLKRTGAETSEHSATHGNGSPTTMNGTITVEGGDVTRGWGAYFADRSAFAPTDLDGDGTTEYASDTDGDGEADVAGASFTTSQLYVRTVTVDVALGERL